MLRRIGSGDKVFPRWGFSTNTEDPAEMFLTEISGPRKRPEAGPDIVNFYLLSVI